MLLVGQLDLPFVRRVAVSMTFLGRPFERDRSSVFSNFEDVSRINPLGRVPALVLDDGTAKPWRICAIYSCPEECRRVVSGDPPVGASDRSKTGGRR